MTNSAFAAVSATAAAAAAASYEQLLDAAAELSTKGTMAWQALSRSPWRELPFPSVTAAQCSPAPPSAASNSSYHSCLPWTASPGPGSIHHTPSGCTSAGRLDHSGNNKPNAVQAADAAGSPTSIKLSKQQQYPHLSLTVAEDVSCPDSRGGLVVNLLESFERSVNQADGIHHAVLGGRDKQAAEQHVKHMQALDEGGGRQQEATGTHSWSLHLDGIQPSHSPYATCSNLEAFPFSLGLELALQEWEAVLDAAAVLTGRPDPGEDESSGDDDDDDLDLDLGRLTHGCTSEAACGSSRSPCSSSSPGAALMAPLMRGGRAQQVPWRAINQLAGPSPSGAVDDADDCRGALDGLQRHSNHQAQLQAAPAAVGWSVFTNWTAEDCSQSDSEQPVVPPWQQDTPCLGGGSSADSAGVMPVGSQACRVSGGQEGEGGDPLVAGCSGLVAVTPQHAQLKRQQQWLPSFEAQEPVAEVMAIEDIAAAAAEHAMQLWQAEQGGDRRQQQQQQGNG
eukprot:gene8378-8562_t